MAELHFNLAFIRFLENHRTAMLTRFFLGASLLGDVTGYILIVTLIYVSFDKTLGVRLSVLALLTMCLNHVLKIIIKNPRPFIREGTYLREWAVSRQTALELATEYSTPSGHAMAGAAFYSYVYAIAENRWVKVAAATLIVVTGLSRPYLGVHYLEDIISGWAIGLVVGVVAVYKSEQITDLWEKLSYKGQIEIAILFSMVLWIATIVINGWRIDGQPRAFLGYAGFLTGIVIGRPLELKIVDFDPRSYGIAAKIARYLLTVVLVIVSLGALGILARAVAPDFSMVGYVCQYVRYTAAGVINIFLAPLIFTAIGLADHARAGFAMQDAVAHSA
jgi:membrane-associated phospholipid phosphatase